MKYYIYAKYLGHGEINGYANGRHYLLKVKRSRFTKRIRIAVVHGFRNQEYRESIRKYDSQRRFERTWKVIERHEWI